MVRESVNCPRCHRNIPADAAFCIYCAAPLKAPVKVDVPSAPVTGPTVRLDPAEARTARVYERPAAPGPAYPPAPPFARPPYPLRPTPVGASKRLHRSDPSGPLFLIGLFVLLATHTFWPGILILIGLTRYAKQHVRGSGNSALRSLLLWSAFASLFIPHMFWLSIVLFLIGSSIHGQRRYSWRP